ncbi:MAG: hypothetical protein P8J59_10800 [Phycisphaerales bacterium]|jgi:hypothetical protein|nr:hypothetical protein [Phycisphaerales bacterium]
MTDPLTDSLRWALAIGSEPERSAVDWLAAELVPDRPDAVAAICKADPESDEDLRRLRLLKSGFKTLRLSGEHSTDRRLAARHYAATIAAGVVRHGCWITRQRPDRLLSALQDLADDDAMDDSLRSIASEAIAIANDRLIDQDS